LKRVILQKLGGALAWSNGLADIQLPTISLRIGEREKRGR